ncbi:hypothetical protein FS837_012831 [Tulasnella sp. UAMH 9824]|nr:hypothetical protein FS837_012831 [Tulasnella sp. UAMH 9824]
MPPKKKSAATTASTATPNGPLPSSSSAPPPGDLPSGQPSVPAPKKKKKKPKAPDTDPSNPSAAPAQAGQPQGPPAPQKEKKKKSKKAVVTANASGSAPIPATQPAPIQPAFPPAPSIHAPVATRGAEYTGIPNLKAPKATPNTAPPVASPVGSTASSITATSTRPQGIKKSSEHDLLDGKVKEATISHQLVTAPLITRDAFTFGDGLANAVPQYGVLGSIVSVHAQGMVEVHNDDRIYLNTNAPFSAVVCGVQGSGKSHTVGVLLESMLIANDSRLGVLPKPLSALVLHFGESGGGAQPCEAAYQCVSTDPTVRSPAITVYVSPTQYNTMKRLYQSIFQNRIQVLPLKINHAELDAKSILSMMSVSTNKEPPLYVQLILNILRELGETFTYTRFKLKLEERAKTFNPAQKAMCDQRLSLLESFLEHNSAKARFKAGEVTIVDLTDPFIDAAGACSLFEIITRLFIRADVGTGKVLVVDEAHKYLTKDQGSEVLTQTLLSIVRQQRHLGTRLIMSTQEPTVVPEALLDLCSITIMHRFSSITWFNHLAKHVSSDFGDEAFDAVVQLQTGQALVLAPAGLGVFQKPGMDRPEVGIFGRRYLIVKTRRRVTADGGASILAV